MKKITLLFAIILFCCLQLTAQTSKTTTLKIGIPANNQFSAERLQKIDKLVQQYIDSNWIAGAIALVAKDGNIVYYNALGYDDKLQNKLMKKDAIFRIASQTKAITSVAVMMLYEDGKFLLDDAISKYIPEFKKPVVLDKFNKDDTSYTTIPAKREITIRDLLTHTSGLGYAQIGNETMTAIYYKAGVVGGIGIKGMTLSENIKKLGHLPLFHQPGEKFTYGLNTDVLGYLVEVISGMSLDEFFKQKIFEPLGMKDTYFAIPKEKQNRLAMLHTEDRTKHVINIPEQIKLNGDFYRDYPNMSPTFYSGGGGLVSTAYDYAVFMQMLLNNGQYNGKHLLSPTSIRLMTMNQIGDLRNGLYNKFGLGFEIVGEWNAARTPTSIGTFSWGGMFSSTYWIDPKEKIVAQFVLQQYPNSHADIAEKFKALVYQTLQ